MKYFALIREYTQKKEDMFIIIEGSSIRDLISVLRNNYKILDNKIFDKNGNLMKGLIFLVNGVHVNQKDFNNYILHEGDITAIIPPVGGG